MRNIEKVFSKYVNETGRGMSAKELCNYADTNPNAVIDSLFKVINRYLDIYMGDKELDKLIELVNNIHIVVMNVNRVDRKIVYRRLRKLDEKIDRIKLEKKNKFVDNTYANKELERLRNSIKHLLNEIDEKDNEQYKFLDYLANEVKNITYLEYTFTNIPFLINSRDKNGNSFFYNMICNYIDSMEESNDRDILYYNNLISLLVSREGLRISDNEKRKCLDLILSTINKFSVGKKQLKKNQKKIERLNKIVGVLRGMRDQNQDITDIANKYHISVFFNEELLEQAKLVKDRKTGELTNRRIIDDYIITIDGENAVEIDDALSCRKLANGNYLVGVHIASVLAYYPYESNIINEAIDRNHSIYLPRKYQNNDNDFTRTIPIFPYDFSANQASLLPNSPKLTRSYYFEIDRYGDIVREEFFKSIITSNKKTTYREVDDVLEHGSSDIDFYNTLNYLKEVTDILDNRYKATDIYEQIKENVEDYTDLRVKRIGAEKIVGQCMMLTGNRVAEYFADESRGYPCLYRVHDVNVENTAKIEAMINNLTKTYGGDQYQKLYQLIAGIYPKGYYATEGHHAGLGLDHYCHCTSALRRAADIVVEHALEVCYDNMPSDKDLDILSDEIQLRAEQINNKQNPIEWFIKDYKRAYKKRRKRGK